MPKAKKILCILLCFALLGTITVPALCVYAADETLSGAWWEELSPCLQWILRWICFGWIWMYVPAVAPEPFPGSITVGSVRVQPLSATLCRIELKSAEGFEDRPSFHMVNRLDWEGLDSTVITGAADTQIVTDAYTVVIPAGGTSLNGITVLSPDGSILWTYTALPLGLQYLPDPIDTPEVWAVSDSPRVIPAEWGYAEQPLLNGTNRDYNGWESDSDAQDVFLFLARGDAKQLRQDFVELTGRAELVPLQTLGLWHSRYWPYSDKDALAIIGRYRAEGFPLDNLVIDTDWRKNASTGYQINTNLFPNMKKFLSDAHSKNVQVIFNDHPEPQKVWGEPVHALAAADLHYRNSNLRSLLSKGLDAWWFDRNWWTTIISPYDGISKESFGMYLYQDITRRWYEESKTGDYARRPLIMGNTDGIDNGVWSNRPPDFSAHRYSIQWTGDDSPANLEQEVAALVRSGAVMSLGYVSADIAGHTGSKPLDSQWVRWSQFAALSPIYRYHHSNQADGDQAPWNFNAASEAIARKFVAMRYNLMPLLYALSKEYYDTGLPLARRLDYYYPQYTESADNTQYLLGDSILVAPLTTWQDQEAQLIPNSAYSHNGQPGLQAVYYKGPEFKGQPIHTEIVPGLQINYTPDSPVPGIVPTDDFSVRYTGELVVGGSGAVLSVASDDGARVYIDGELIIDNAERDNENLRRQKESISAGTHALRVDVTEVWGNFGINLYAAPAPAPDALDTRTVFIPDGTWIDAFSGESYTGPQTIAVSHTINTSPIFVRAGSITPLAANADCIDEKPWDTIALDIYPGGDGTTTLYEDDQSTVGYKDGKYRTTALSTFSNGGTLSVNIAAAEGNFAGALQNRAWKIRVHIPTGKTLLSAAVDGRTRPGVIYQQDIETMPFAFSGASPDTDVAEIAIPAADVDTAHLITIQLG
ncbi:MAG: DUF5110 domain-containing protein [Oscillospiraceae bacterium]|nr:DUF5110 domain-containing protein [Oscillospiraceae bacterium]